VSVYEAVMLICFGSAWPVSIYKSAVSRTAKGKSAVFLFIVLAGYVAGILHKVHYNLDWVTALYAINGLMVLADIVLTLRNVLLDRRSRA